MQQSCKISIGYNYKATTVCMSISFSAGIQMQCANFSPCRTFSIYGMYATLLINDLWQPCTTPVICLIICDRLAHALATVSSNDGHLAFQFFITAKYILATFETLSDFINTKEGILVDCKYLWY